MLKRSGLFSGKVRLLQRVEVRLPRMATAVLSHATSGDAMFQELSSGRAWRPPQLMGLLSRVGTKANSSIKDNQMRVDRAAFHSLTSDWC